MEYNYTTGKKTINQFFFCSFLFDKKILSLIIIFFFSGEGKKN